MRSKRVSGCRVLPATMSFSRSCYKCVATDQLWPACVATNQPAIRLLRALPPAIPPGAWSLTSYNCGQQGHVSSACTNETVPKTCYRCNETGHVSRDCPQAAAAGGSECYRCGESGHIARQCPKAGGAPPARGGRGGCYNCGGFGHISRDCASAPGALSSLNSARTKCYNCGRTGHISRECPQPPQRVCYTCGSSDHLAADCQQASA